MASKEAQPAQKKRGMFSQLKQIFAFTYKEDKALPWLCGGAFIAPVILCVVLGLVFHWGWFAWITSIILALMIGLLLFTIVLTRRADAVGFKQLEGHPGAAISVLGNMKRAGFDFPQEPVWVDPRSKDAVWRGTGYQGQTIIKKRTYIPSTHKNALMRKLRPRTRFMMSKDQLTTLNERLHTLQRKNGMGIPKGMDPMRTQKVSRRAMRGR